MGSALDYQGLATVIAVAGDEVELCPATDDGLGGPAFRAPLSALSHSPAVGDVLVGQFLSEDGAWLVEAERAGTANRVKVTAKADGWEIRRGHDRSTVPYPVELPDRSDRDALNGCDFWAFTGPVAGFARAGHFQDARGFLAGRDAQRRAKEVRVEEKVAHQRLARWPQARTFEPGMFVNPYNFVPLPKAVPNQQDPDRRAVPDRRDPAGHDQRLAELFHGRIDLTLTSRTPLLLRDAELPRPAEHAGATEGRRTVVPTRAGRRVVPGSAMKGAVRAAFEAITGSCLRVVDGDFMPAYRDVLRATNKSGWHLIEVTEVDREGRPTRARLCEGTIWVALDVLQHVLGPKGVATGARFALVGTPKRIGERDEVRHNDQVAGASDPRGHDYVLMVTDVRARPRRKAVTFAAGRLPAADTPVIVDPAAWRRFEAASDGATDNKRGGRDRPSDDIQLSIRTDKSVGSAVRHRQGLATSGRVGLRIGHVLWAQVRRGGDGVVLAELSFAQTWRHAARGAAPHMADRIPPEFYPCTGVAGLCPACRVFGSANTKGGRTGGDRPYRGHVRVGEFSIAGGTEQITLPPMGQPRPASGQMYLTHDQVPEGLAARAGIGADPLREWGSALDEDQVRTIRGRKFYWRVGDAAGRPPRHRHHASQTGAENAGTMLATAEVVASGAQLQGSLVFENLSAEELGALLASVHPALMSQHQHPARRGAGGEFCLSVGGGKPLGMGACVVTGLRVVLEGAQDRYRGAVASEADPADLVSAFLQSSDEEVRAVWPDFLEMVRFDAVDPALVSYPRDTDWPESPNDPNIYKAGFDWWKWSAGMPWDGLGSANDDLHASHSYLVLPRPTADDPRLPIQPSGEPAPEHIKEQMKTRSAGGSR